MFSNILIMARSRVSSGVHRVLDYAGIENVVDESQESLSWQSSIFRRFSATYGAKLPYIIYSCVLGILFIIAVFGDMNEMEIHTRETAHSHGSLRGSPAGSTNGTIPTDNAASVHNSSNNQHTSSGHSSGHSSGSLLFSMLVSFVTWLAFIQIIRCLFRVSMNYRGAAGGGSGTATQRSHGRVESAQFMMQLMQLGRAAGGGGGGLSNRLRMAMQQRDFTGDDYEMLQTLDDNQQQRRQQGAQQTQIDRLPLHCVTAEEVAEHQNAPGGPPTCNICLGPYELRDEVRTVPCMHQFHKDCIDTWLKDKAICPVCKYRAVI